MVGELIRAGRTARGIGQRQLAAMVGVTASFISQLENNRTSPPSELTMRKIADAIGTDADELLAASGRVPSDVQEILVSRPSLMKQIRAAL
jgi:transcriptional regulator with XRE-family HTH domain